MKPTSLTKTALLDRYADILAFYDQFLDSPAGQSAPQRSSIVFLRDHIQQLREGTTATPAHLNCLLTSSRHLATGIPAAELGLDPEDDLNDEEARIVVEECADALRDRAGKIHPRLVEIVDALARHEYPRTPYAMALFLGLAMNTADQVNHTRRLQSPPQA